MAKMKKLWHNLSPMKLILGGYCLIILLGTFLLSLPFASVSPQGTSVSDCFFTATSATCVTGLVRVDTYTNWTLFGQLVILGLIQIGGIGFMTIAIMVMVLAKKKIGLGQRYLMQSSISAPQLGGIVKLAKFTMLGTFLIEGIGAILLCFVFVPMYGWAKGIYFAIFHSISAFCNAGFDLMGGTTGAFSSLSGFAGNVYFNVIIMVLIIVGGLGFFVWYDLYHNRFHLRRLTLQSKMVLSISTALVVGGGLALLVLEWGSPLMEGRGVAERLTVSFFQAVTARTAGYTTADLSLMTEAGQFVMIVLMFIGGSTGSMAGGIKTTTFWVLCISIVATFKRKKNIEAFGRRMDEHITRTASCVFMTYLLLIGIVSVIISAIEKLPMMPILFEATSAMATVGLSFGITPTFSFVSKMLLAFLMICGRVGSVTILLAFSSEKSVIASRLPLEKVQVG